MVLKRIHLSTTKRKISTILILTNFFIHLITFTEAQRTNNKDSLEFFTLKQCIDYALSHQPAIRQSQINESIAKITNDINLSGWYPQVNITGNLSHYLELPTTYV